MPVVDFVSNEVFHRRRKNLTKKKWRHSCLFE